MMARLTDEAGEPSLTFTFEFPDRTIEVSGVAGATTRKTYILDPRTSGLPEAMSGKVNAVNLRIGGQEQGMLSLSGSTRALLGALSSCLKFGD
ncbi:hypothetical protein AB433_02555 [Croceicoccus naphthovorans]|uniref:Uncharacterized protein n=2 Tax=Croceicoccus naphthovorans TaxID=1348774 RepID=A0A0G3XD57_9SPHN|nr:hypothetical protein AB433_02555 [Croceicoccus naphthovorans]